METDKRRKDYIFSNRMAASLVLLLLSLSSYAQKESFYQYSLLRRTLVVYPGIVYKSHQHYN